MTVRLPAPFGSRIRRDTRVLFSFNGRRLCGLEGDTVASALLAADIKLMSRSFKYHRPRLGLTFAGDDAATLVTIDHRANCFADTEMLCPAMEVTSQNHLGSLEYDLGAAIGLLARFLPVGFYYKAFYRPKGIWELWAKFFRRSAGLGRINPSKQNVLPRTKRYKHVDHLVVGGGYHGMRAALDIAEDGQSVLLVEQDPVLGGSLLYSRIDPEGVVAGRLARKLIGEIETNNNIEVMTTAHCNGWYADHFVPVLQGQNLFKIRASSVTLATGSLEQPAVFRNNDLPGVMLGSGVQRLVHLYGVKVGHRAVIIAGNDEAYGLALDLLDADIEVAAIIELRAGPATSGAGSALMESVVKRGVRIITGVEPHAAVARRGQLSAIQLRRQTSEEVHVAHYELLETLKCDLLCSSVGFLPQYQVPCQAGARLRFDEEENRFSLDGLPQGLRLAGSVTGRWGLDELVPDSNHAWPIFPHPKGKEFVDQDEDLQIVDIVNAVADGFTHVQLVKRYSTVGMGPSQGRHSALATAKITAAANRSTIDETGVTTARPPLRAEPLVVSAGEVHFPARLSSMHGAHLKLAAHFLHAGTWYRPAYYPQPGEDRITCIEREAINVRRNVGMIDLSTLGGIDVRGPAASELLNRLYTGGFKGLAIGKSKYALMCNESGVVIDDGVAARLAETHFYVTATTTGVENVYRQMLKWNVQWQLDVDITNVTSAYCVVNLAGPKSKEVLARLTATDLDEAAFPYLGVREGEVAGIPARILRVGFVGELGYEIHVPQTFGRHLWDALAAVGATFDIAPFGVEAQRLLRLEKGHIIIGQDTDAMTHLRELEMSWAVSRKKPFFIGDRTTAEIDISRMTRRLAGFTVESANRVDVPQESHLVLEDGRMVGRVTSAAYSPTLDKIVGLAYVPATSAEGDTITIRVDRGRGLQATLCELPFYDPQTERQRVSDVSVDVIEESFPGRISLVSASGGDLESGVVIVDRTLSDRCGIRGRTAASWLESVSMLVPDKPNRALVQKDGTLLARLSIGEFLLLGGSDYLGCLPEAADSNYSLPRADSHVWLVVSGAHSRELLQAVCSVDLRVRSFSDGDVAQTLMFGISVILIQSEGSFHLCADITSSQYLHDALGRAFNSMSL
ncbi:MAG: FAD-dependent oxidoreductase [Gammaproteobacteria bacterium]|nr:FAD-dependent oxidoreductase [Gammaproteobacteria bacterium]